MNSVGIKMAVQEDLFLVVLLENERIGNRDWGRL